MSLSAIRKRMFTSGSPALNAELGELARDVSNAIGALVGLRIVTYTANYTEPLNVGYDHEPSGGVLALRVRKDASPETAVPGNARMPFVWNAQKQQVQVSSIDGCVLGTRYRFNFLMVG